MQLLESVLSDMSEDTRTAMQGLLQAAQQLSQRFSDAAEPEDEAFRVSVTSIEKLTREVSRGWRDREGCPRPALYACLLLVLHM